MFWNTPRLGRKRPINRLSYAERTALFNGVSAQRSQVKMADITDGTSCTYLAGENFLDPDYYFTGTDWGDDQSAYAGDCDDQCRWTGQDTATTVVTNPPLPDTPGDAIGPSSARPSERLPNGSLRRFGSHDQLFDPPRDPPPAGNRSDGLLIHGKW